jgi:hypothetical protein
MTREALSVRPGEGSELAWKFKYFKNMTCKFFASKKFTQAFSNITDI